MNKINNALIMAAGRGMRMMPLTKKIPKAMAILNGQTLIENGISKLTKQIKDVHITVGYKGPILASHVIEKGARSVINTQNKGNCWWLFNSLLKNLNEPILVLTCDNIVKIDMRFILSEFKRLKEPICMLVSVKSNYKFEGDNIFHKNFIVKNISRNIKTKYYASGIQVLNPFKINKLVKKKNDFKNLWSALIKLKKLKCTKTYKKKWAAVDTLAELKNLNK